MNARTPIAMSRARLREEVIARLRMALAAAPPDAAERVILFGSLARGSFDGASDADLLVIGGAPALAPAVWDAAGRECDIIAWSATDWARGQANHNPFVAAILAEGVELWRAPGLAPLATA
jgi:predicted nucleotidyltransferase